MINCVVVFWIVILDVIDYVIEELFVRGKIYVNCYWLVDKFWDLVIVVEFIFDVNDVEVVVEELWYLFVIGEWM